MTPDPRSTMLTI